MPSKGFSPNAWTRQRGKKGSREGDVHRRLSKFKAKRRAKSWFKSRRGNWSVARGEKLVEHRCQLCGLVKFRRRYQSLVFYRPKWSGKPTILSNAIRGKPGVPIPIANECRCVPGGRPSNRVIRLLAEDSR